MTDKQRRTAIIYLIYKLLTSFWFMGSVWLYFYRLFITDQQVGVLDAIAFSVGLVAEVPAGALADKFGRKRVVGIGQFLAGAGIIIQVFGSNYPSLLIGQAIVMIGLSFASGADDALFFDKLKFDQASHQWRKLVTRAGQVSLIGSLTSGITGGLLYSVDPRIGWYLSGVAFIGAAVLIWSVKEDHQRPASQKIGVEIRGYLQNIKTGFKQFRRPELWLYVPIIVAVQGLFYTVGFGLLRIILLSRFHFSPFWGTVVVAISSLITVWILAYMHKHTERLSEKQTIAFISLIAAASLLLAVPDIGVLGAIVVFVLYAGEHALYPFMSETLNVHAPEQQRATVLSVGSFIKNLPYVGLAPLIGALNTAGHLEYFLVLWSVLVVMATFVYLARKKRDDQIKVTT